VGIVTWPSSPGRNGRPISAWFPANCSTSNERAGGSTHPYEVQDRELSLRQTATPGLEGGDPILLLAGNTSSLALKGSCLPPRLLGCTRPRNTAGHRIASLPTSHLLLCTDSDRVSDSPPGTTVHAANFFLTGVYLPRPARCLSAPRQPTLRGAFCFDNSRTRAGPRGAQEPHRTAAGARTGEPQSKVGVGIRPSSRGREIRIRLG